MHDVDLLERVPVLARLPDELLLRVAAEAEGTTVRAGDWVFREGEAADSLFVVRSGRLEVVQEGPPERVLRVLRRGEVMGELALLRGNGRSASVRAQRDSRLLEIGREQFEALIAAAPAFALDLARAIGERLATSVANGVGEAPPRTIATVSLDGGTQAERAAGFLASELERHGSLATLDACSAGRESDMIEAIDRAERDADRVLLIGGADRRGDSWTDVCLREAELVVAFTSGAPRASWLGRPASLHGCELILVGGPEPERLRATLRPRGVEVVPSSADLGSRMAALARRLAGRAVGLVLSGGGARAFAHIGVLEELTAAGIQIDRIGGVSLGAIIGAAAAMQIDTADLYGALEHSFVNNNPSNDFTLPAFSLIRGRKTRTLLEQHLGQARIEELPVDFFCLSCDLIARETVAHRDGSIVDAVYASLAIPGVFPPVNTKDGRLLVDGGVLDNLPVATMAARSEGPIIAVDVTAQGSSPGQAAGRRPVLDVARRSARRYLTGSSATVPRMGETMLRTLTVGSADTTAAAHRHADLVICPDVQGIRMMDWKALPRVRELGRRAAASALAAAPDSLLG